MFYINAETRGNNVLLTYVKDGEVTHAKVGGYQPEMFYPANGATPTHHDLVHNKPLVAKKFNNMYEANQAIREASDTEGMGSVYGNRNFKYTFLHENFTDMEASYDASKIRGFMLDIECPSEVGFPEPAKAEWPINLMCIYDTKTEKYYLWGEQDFDVTKYTQKLADEGVDSNDVVYYVFKDEVVRMEHMVQWWSNNFPAYITGWNTSSFDNPYIVNRLQRLGIDPARLSPWGVTNVREREFQGREILSVNILGIADLDYLELYQKNRFKMQESYKLGHIAHVELGKAKVDFSDIATDLRTLHKKDWGIYTTYNVMDVALIKQLDEKLGYLAITFAVAYAAGINYSDVSSPVATWSNIFYRDQIGKGIVLPPKKNNDKVSYEGGYVKFPQQGKHRWVCSFDLNSLYPHLIIGSNISPETITPIMVPDANVESILQGIQQGSRTFNLPKENVSVCASGFTFKNDKMGVAGQQMERLYKERKAIKREMLAHEQDVEDIKGRNEGYEGLYTKYNIKVGNYDELLDSADRQAVLKDGGQMVRKILLNSFYGALANIHFELFDIRLAESITKQGQLAIRWAGDWVNKELNALLKTDKVDYVVYTDTDSIYVTLEEIVNRMKYQDKSTAETVTMLDKFCEARMQPMIDNGYKSLQWHCNSFSQKMIMAREVISDNSVFCTKKRYAMSVWNSEGVAFEEAYIKTMGLDVVKSSTPQVVRGAMKKTLSMILNYEEADVQKYIKEFKKEFRKFKPEEIAFPRGVNGLEDKYCDSNGDIMPSVTIPINSRAGLLYNKCVRDMGLNQYPEIVVGDKIKYIHLTLPNKLQSNVIGFSEALPPEFNVHKKIDYELMFFKVYLKPMKDILELIGWSDKPQATLESFFG